MQENAIETRRFESPDQRLDMKERGGISIVKMADGSLGMHAIFEPGCTWEADEKPLLGSPDSCPMRHTGYCISGRLVVRMLDTGRRDAHQHRRLLRNPAGAFYVKVEAFNPAGSVKDRLALSIIEEAEQNGSLSPGQTVVEATSGNTGIGLAMVCAAKGYPLVVTMADSFSVERRKLMRMMGAKVVLTPRAQKGLGMYRKAVELAEANGWFLARPFETEANARIHENTTAREILAILPASGWITGSPATARAAL